MLPMDNTRKWHEWLTAIGTVIALVLAGITFYYQFLRDPRSLTGIVLPLIWNPDGTATVRTIIWNDGMRDEIVEAAYLDVPGESGKKSLFGPEIIHPNEARELRATVKTDAKVPRQQPPERFKPDNLVVEEGAKVEIDVVDRNGKLLVNSIMVSVVLFLPNTVGTHQNLEPPERKRIDLLSGKRWDERD